MHEHNARPRPPEDEPTGKQWRYPERAVFPSCPNLRRGEGAQGAVWQLTSEQLAAERVRECWQCAAHLSRAGPTGRRLWSIVR